MKEKIEQQLATFFECNKSAALRRDNGTSYIANPWNDESLRILIPDDSLSDFLGLNGVVLPPRFAGIFHKDKKEMEFIYAPFPENLAPTRAFTFTVDGLSYDCKFEEASQLLYQIASHVEPTEKLSHTDYRNFIPMARFFGSKRAAETKSKLYSFFIRNVETCADDFLIPFTRQLNFHLKYFDRQSPEVIIYPEVQNDENRAKQLQLIEADFPREITTTRKDPFIMDLMGSARGATLRLKYIYLYQVLEHAAFYFLEDELRRKMTGILKSPSILTKIDTATRDMLDLLADYRLTDELKIVKVVELYCKPEDLWLEIQNNIEYFSRDHEFEGGVKIKALITKDMTLEQFRQIWVPKTPDTLRKIRNALVHGRESRQGLAIIPSLKNNRRLRPWVYLIERIAEQIIIYGN